MRARACNFRNLLRPNHALPQLPQQAPAQCLPRPIVRVACFLLGVVACLTLPGIMRPARSLPTLSPKNLAILIVSDSSSLAQRRKENQIVELIHRGLDDQGLPHSLLPILVYHMNKPAERAYCIHTLHIRPSDLVFVGLAEQRGDVVRSVILRETNVHDPAAAVASLLDKAIALITGSHSPTSNSSPSSPITPMGTPTVPPSPDYNSPQGTHGPHIVTAEMCHGVTNGGDPVRRGSSFTPRETFYVAFDVSGLHQGTLITAQWYYGATLIRNGRIVSNRIGSSQGWFSLSPATYWRTGMYRVLIFVDGVQQATQYFRVTNE